MIQNEENGILENLRGMLKANNESVVNILRDTQINFKDH